MGTKTTNPLVVKREYHKEETYMEKHNQTWKKKEVTYLEENYRNPFVEIEEIVLNLGRTKQAVIAKAFSLRMFRPPKRFREIVTNRK